MKSQRSGQWRLGITTAACAVLAAAMLVGCSNKGSTIVDAGKEAGTDAGTDASVDASIDVSIEGGKEGGIDAGAESAADSGGATEVLRFVWLADSRGEQKDTPVNTTALNAIIAQIGTLNPKPAFITFGGDQSFRGYIGTSYTFQAWKDLFSPLTDAGIPLFTALGNHELYVEHYDGGGFVYANQVAYQAAFSNNPTNGPTGYDHLTYSFTSPKGESFFAVLDPYYITADTVPSDLGGNIDDNQMNWLTAQVAQTKAVHKFLFIHTPYYYVNNDPEEPSAANASYTKLWAFLDTNKFDVYACGHSHLFSRRTIDSTVDPNPQTTPETGPWKNNVVQLLNGSCGAGPDSDAIDATIAIPWNVHNDAQTYYFSVVDISGPTVTVNSYRGYSAAYTVFDTFTVTRGN